MRYNTSIITFKDSISPQSHITKACVEDMNFMLMHIGDKVALEAELFALRSGSVVVSKADIKNAVSLVIPGKLGEKAILEGNKAVNRYYREHASARDIFRSIILFPAGEIIRHFTGGFRVSHNTLVFAAAVLQTICGEILDIVDNVTIMTRYDLKSVLETNEELNALTKIAYERLDEM